MSQASSPSIVPGFDVTVHIVMSDFGKLGRAYLETDEAQADLETVIRNLLAGEYTDPCRVVAFNTAEGWSRDVSEDVAWQVLRRAAERNHVLPVGTHHFCVLHVGEREVLRQQNAIW